VHHRTNIPPLKPKAKISDLIDNQHQVSEFASPNKKMVVSLKENIGSKRDSASLKDSQPELSPIKLARTKELSKLISEDLS
jgi:hypothetical protein